MDPDLIREAAARAEDFGIGEPRAGIEGEGDLALLDLHRDAIGPDSVDPVGCRRAPEYHPHPRAGSPHVGCRLVSDARNPLRACPERLVGDRVYHSIASPGNWKWTL